MPSQTIHAGSSDQEIGPFTAGQSQGFSLNGSDRDPTLHCRSRFIRRLVGEGSQAILIFETFGRIKIINRRGRIRETAAPIGRKNGLEDGRVSVDPHLGRKDAVIVDR